MHFRRDLLFFELRWGRGRAASLAVSWVACFAYAIHGAVLRHRPEAQVLTESVVLGSVLAVGLPLVLLAARGRLPALPDMGIQGQTEAEPARRLHQASPEGFFELDFPDTEDLQRAFEGSGGDAGPVINPNVTDVLREFDGCVLVASHPGARLAD